MKTWFWLLLTLTFMVGCAPGDFADGRPQGKTSCLSGKWKGIKIRRPMPSWSGYGVKNPAADRMVAIGF